MIIIATVEKEKFSAQKKYDKENTRFVGLKLNKKTDSDILSAIDGKTIQAELKRLIRQGIKAEQSDM